MPRSAPAMASRAVPGGKSLLTVSWSAGKKCAVSSATVRAGKRAPVGTASTALPLATLTTVAVASLPVRPIAAARSGYSAKVEPAVTPLSVPAASTVRSPLVLASNRMAERLREPKLALSVPSADGFCATCPRWATRSCTSRMMSPKVASRIPGIPSVSISAVVNTPARAPTAPLAVSCASSPSCAAARWTQ